jgi:hypothetical protein
MWPCSIHLGKHAAALYFKGQKSLEPQEDHQMLVVCHLQFLETLPQHWELRIVPGQSKESFI